MQDFFKLDEDFDTIIRNVLSEKNITNIDDIQMITTGWTNIVFKAYSQDGNYYFRFPRDDFWERTIVKDYEFCKYINGKTSFETCKLELHYDKKRPFSVHKEIPGTPIAHVMKDLSVEDVEKVYKTTNCDLIMIARASFGRPWFFEQINKFLKTGQILSEPTKVEIFNIMLRHVKKIIEFEGEVLGLKKARAAAMRYFHGFKNAAKIRKLCSKICCFEDVLNLKKYI